MDWKQYPQLQAAVNKIKRGNLPTAVVLLVAVVAVAVLETVMYLKDRTKTSSLMAAVVILVMGVILIASVLKERKICAASWAKASADDLSRMEEHASKAPLIDGILYLPTGIAADSEPGVVYVPYRDIIWMSENPRVQNMFGMGLSKNYCISMVDRDKKAWQVLPEMRKEARLDILGNERKKKIAQLYKHIREHRPDVLTGEDDEYTKLLTKDFDELVRRADGLAAPEPESETVTAAEDAEAAVTEVTEAAAPEDATAEKEV